MVRAKVLMLLQVFPAPPVLMLQRSPEQEQMVAVTPPPSSLVLQPEMVAGPAGPPHSRVRRDTDWKCPRVMRQVWEEAGQLALQPGSGLNWSQEAWEEL